MIKIYSKKTTFKEIEKVIKTYYPSIKLKYKNYSKKYEQSGSIAYSKIKENAIYYYGRINEYVILHELNHILVNKSQKINSFSDQSFNKIIKRLKKSFKDAEIPNMLYPLHIHEEYLVDKNVFKLNSLLIKPIIKEYILQSKKRKGFGLYCDFLTLSYLHKLSNSIGCKKEINIMKKKLPNKLINITNNLVLGKDVYNSYMGLLDEIDVGMMGG
jgi:hypothetical protein